MIIFTNAPKDYDYWYVTELIADCGRFNSGIDKDRPVRKLDIEASEVVIRGQRNRYSSGLYASLDQTEVIEWIKYGFFIPKAGGDENFEASPDTGAPPTPEETA